MWHRLELTGYWSLEVPRPGAVAHMSLHQKLTMSKSLPDTNGGQRRCPRFKPGDRLSVYVGDLGGGAGVSRLLRFGERAYMWGCESGQHVFAILFQKNRKPAEIRPFDPALACSRWSLGPGLQGAW